MQVKSLAGRFVIAMLSLVALTSSAFAQTSTHDSEKPETHNETVYSYEYASTDGEPHVTQIWNGAGQELKEVSNPQNDKEYKVEYSNGGKEVTITFGGPQDMGESITVETTRSGGSTPSIENEKWS